MIFEIAIGETVLETKRLILRSFRRSDLDDFYAYASVPGVGECAGWPHHVSIEDSSVILDKFIREDKTFALVLRDTGRVVGSIGLEYPAREKKWAFSALCGRELGYVLAKDCWGHGYMTEAIKEVIRWLFSCGVEILYCGHFTDNVRSRRVIEKCGFLPLGPTVFDAPALHRSFEGMDYYLKNPAI